MYLIVTNVGADVSVYLCSLSTDTAMNQPCSIVKNVDNIYRSDVQKSLGGLTVFSDDYRSFIPLKLHLRSTVLPSGF